MRRREVAERIDRVLVGLGGEPRDVGSIDDRLRRLERAVIDSEARLDEALGERQRLIDAVDQLAVGVVTIVDGEIVHRNEVARRYAAGRPSDALVEAAIQDVHAAMSDENPLRKTIRLLGPPRRTLELDGRPTPSGAIVIIRDISATERLDRVRRDFVANISHELKTPIGALTLLAETLESESDPATVERLCGRVLTEANRAANIVEDLLELSRVESGEAHETAPIVVGDLVDEATEQVRSAAEDREVVVETDVDGQVVVPGDRRQLVSALVNVLDNAIRYSDRGGDVSIEARLSGEDAEIRVTDHGIGIPARDLDRVFERFYRVDRSRSRDRGGTGLGLSIVRHVVDNHGGEASIASVEGRGAVVILRLPGMRIAAVDTDG